MKKLGKLLLASLVAFMMMFSFAQPVVFAQTDAKTEEKAEGTTAVDTIVDQLNKKKATPNTDEATDIGGTIIGWIWGISIIVAVIVLMIIGLKFILGSTSEKAEYKKSLIPIVVGVLVLVFATTIVQVLFNIKK